MSIGRIAFTRLREKLHQMLDVFSVLGNHTRIEIMLILYENEGKLTITDIYKLLSKTKYKVAYKNVAENIKLIETNEFILTKKVKDSVGQHTIVYLTKKGNDALGYLNGFPL